MAKKKRKDKELARLRREVEVLRAQLSTSEIAETTKGRLVQLAGQGKKETKVTKATEEPKPATTRTSPPTQTVDPKFIKADLLKSGILTLIALGVIVALTFLS